MQQYKNSGKGSFKPCNQCTDQDNVNSFEEEEPARPQSKRLYSPKYVSPTTTATDHYNSPRNTSSQLGGNPSRHWKSYLAPELSRLSPRETGNMNLEPELDPAPEISGNSINRLKGYSSAYNLRQMDNSNLSSQLQEDRADYQNVQPQQSIRKEEYSRRKEEIMNRIKLLQERASLEDERPQSPTQQNPGQSSQLRYTTGAGREEELSARVAALEQRVETMAGDFEARLKKQLVDLEKRLRGQLQPQRAPSGK